MIVDHIAWFLNVPIEWGTIRFGTRLSMPLFCLLMGYFLIARSKVHGRRWLQIALVALVLNLGYYAFFGQVEILVSLVVCYGVYSFLGKWFLGLVPVVYLFPWDPSVGFFDFPWTVVAGCVAQGMVLQRWGLRVALATGIGMLPACLLIPAPTQYVLYFVPVATLLGAWAADHPRYRLSWLEFVGRHPLKIYATQYLVILLLKRWLEAA